MNHTMKEKRVKNKKIFHSHAAKYNYQEDEERTHEDEYSCEEYVLICAFTGSVSPGNDTWLVDSCSSKHMIGYKDSLSCLVQKDSPHKVMFGDDWQYPIKGMGESSYKLDYGNSMKMKDILYILGLNKNILSISALDKKGLRVAFVDGYVLMWTKGKTIDDAVVIGVEEGGI